jgi:hypothetical protein
VPASGEEAQTRSARRSLRLGLSLIARYDMTYLNDDYEEAASILDEIITETSLRKPQDKSLDEAQGRATCLVKGLAVMRLNAYGTPESSEHAIYRTYTCVSSSSIREHFPFAASSIDSEVTAEQRFLYFGSIEGVKASSGDPLLSQPMPGRLESDQALERT